MRNASRKGMRFFATLTAARMNDMAGAPAASTTGGMRASSRHKTTPHLDLTPMPTGTVSTGYNADGTMVVQVIATGFTSGSAYWADVFANGEANPFGELTANSGASS